MKISSVYIDGMHNAHGVRYSFDHVNYLFGDNGAGKSTVLEAIQLALLGYIPGHNKTNQSAFTHASSSAIDVQVTLENGSENYVVERKIKKVLAFISGVCYYTKCPFERVLGFNRTFSSVG